MLQPGRRRSPPPDHLRPLRRALQLRGELLNLPVPFPRSPAIGIIAAPSITVSRRTAMSPVRLRRPNQSGATTYALILIRWIFSTHAHDLIHSKSADWRIICEVLWWWRHHIDQSTFWLGPCPRGSCRGTRPTGQPLWVNLSRYEMFCQLFQNSRNCWNLRKFRYISFLIRKMHIIYQKVQKNKIYLFNL
jgi:hypothetical protein